MNDLGSFKKSRMKSKILSSLKEIWTKDGQIEGFLRILLIFFTKIITDLAQSINLGLYKIFRIIGCSRKQLMSLY